MIVSDNWAMGASLMDFDQDGVDDVPTSHATVTHSYTLQMVQSDP